MACVAIGCKSRMGTLPENNIKLSFHRFPKEPSLKKKWIRNMKRQNWVPSQYSRLCSLHFEDSCFRSGYQTKVLHSDAVPTLFPVVQLVQYKKTPRGIRPTRYDTVGPLAPKRNMQEFIQMKNTISKQNKIIQELKKNVQYHKLSSASHAKKLKNLKKKFNRQTKTLAETTSIINELIKTKFKMDKDKIVIFLF